MKESQTLYRASTGLETSTALNHLGSVSAACSRAISSFGGQGQIGIMDPENFLFMPDNGISSPRILTSKQLIQEFANAMVGWTIRGYEANIINPLELKDIWLDDPIGSGGMAIFENTPLSKKEYEELWSIFRPFKKPIHPKDLAQKYSRKEIKKLYVKLKADPIGKRELASRRKRAQYVGEDFSQSRFQETVWVDLTLKLRNWAIANDYDAFAYKNYEEGNGCLSYSPLTESCLSSRKSELVFAREKYISLAISLLPKYVKSALEIQADRTDIRSIMCLGQSPGSFWA